MYIVDGGGTVKPKDYNLKANIFDEFNFLKTYNPTKFPKVSDPIGDTYNNIKNTVEDKKESIESMGLIMGLVGLLVVINLLRR